MVTVNLAISGSPNQVAPTGHLKAEGGRSQINGAGFLPSVLDAQPEERVLLGPVTLAVSDRSHHELTGHARGGFTLTLRSFLRGGLVLLLDGDQIIGNVHLTSAGRTPTRTGPENDQHHRDHE